MNLLKIGLVGCGYLGVRHLLHLCDMETVEVSGVWDTDPKALAKAADEFNVSAAENLSELIDRSDAVDIVTPTSTHYEIGVKAAGAGKPIFVEKPICATYGEGSRLLEKAGNSGVIVQVGHIERYNRAFRSLKGVDVQPHFIEAHRLSPWNPRGGDVAVVHDLMIHDLDLILALSHDFPKQVHASGVEVVTDSVDIANARLEFENGLVANVTASRISLKVMRKLRIFGSNEYIALDLAQGTCEYIGAVSSGSSIPPEAKPIGELGEESMRRTLYMRYLPVQEGDALKLQLEAFRDSIYTGIPAAATGDDGLKALKLADLIVANIRERE